MNPLLCGLVRYTVSIDPPVSYSHTVSPIVSSTPGTVSLCIICALSFPDTLNSENSELCVVLGCPRIGDRVRVRVRVSVRIRIRVRFRIRIRVSVRVRVRVANPNPNQAGASI